MKRSTASLGRTPNASRRRAWIDSQAQHGFACLGSAQRVHRQGVPSGMEPKDSTTCMVVDRGMSTVIDKRGMMGV